MRSLIARQSLIAFAAVALAACSAGGSATATAVAPTVSDAWVRPPMGEGNPAAGYLTIVNSSGDADALVGVSSPAAGSVEMHETTTDATGMMGMQPVDRIDVPAGGTVSLKPGGLHLMIMDLKQPIEVGSKVELDLVFEHAGKVVVQADVKQG